MSTTKAIGTLGAAIILIAIFFVLTGAVGVREHWAGFLFLFQWSMMEGMKLNRLPRSALGALTGVAIASLPTWLTPLLGAGAALAVMLFAVLVAVFLLIREMAGLFINPATMAFLTVATIPQIVNSTKPTEVFLGIAAGVIIFGGLAAIQAAIQRALAGRKAKAAKTCATSS
ncbi:hypothetical protein HHL26_00990 [Sphingobium sp. TB-6]|uniref:hypothetical protein n=1 Tax=Sphingobium sp. TB-6 TaxID=2728850 RepID=UPI00146ECEC1|nr:hypothetical protein [Sphingobium sp. TB-6]NML87646.1 hypothetical protein [Sphingobium sp. TB-6]